MAIVSYVMVHVYRKQVFSAKAFDMVDTEQIILQCAAYLTAQQKVATLFSPIHFRIVSHKVRGNSILKAGFDVLKSFHLSNILWFPFSKTAGLILIFCDLLSQIFELIL